VIVTTPPEIVPEPRVFEPLVIVIVPVASDGTVAVIVTGAPYVLGPEVVTVTVGAALFTTCTRIGDVAEL
jgi:hypothetical protein